MPHGLHWTAVCIITCRRADQNNVNCVCVRARVFFICVCVWDCTCMRICVCVSRRCVYMIASSSVDMHEIRWLSYVCVLGVGEEGGITFTCDSLLLLFLFFCCCMCKCAFPFVHSIHLWAHVLVGTSHWDREKERQVELVNLQLFTLGYSADVDICDEYDNNDDAGQTRRKCELRSFRPPG